LKNWSAISKTSPYNKMKKRNPFYKGSRRNVQEGWCVFGYITETLSNRTLRRIKERFKAKRDVTKDIIKSSLYTSTYFTYQSNYLPYFILSAKTVCTVWTVSN
jgi:hypothetical protein